MAVVFTVGQTRVQERIRGPNLATCITKANGVPFEEGLARANAQGLVIASNARLSKALVGSDEWEGIRNVFICRSGTMTAYVEPGLPLGKQVEYTDPETGVKWVFPVPEAYQGKKDAILVAEHPEYALEVDGNNRIVHPTNIDIVEEFPGNFGWYFPDSKYGIPAGEDVTARYSHLSYPANARYLLRINKRVGPAVRGYDDFSDDARQCVDLYGAPSIALGMAVETVE
ncbi:MAG: hypothetical protein Q7S22_02835 [Candidatus Micrarchaeota archaeon]|nr:hypothetical protein [Candidatus Micrarchaeota archaeon]